MRHPQVQSIKLTAFSSGQSDPGESPTVVKLFVNRVNLGFEDVDDVDPTQVLTLTAADLAEDADPIKLQYVRFQRVKSITLYIEENGGADVTSIGSLRFMGRGLATTNMNVRWRGGEMFHSESCLCSCVPRIRFCSLRLTFLHLCLHSNPRSPFANSTGIQVTAVRMMRVESKALRAIGRCWPLATAQGAIASPGERGTCYSTALA